VGSISWGTVLTILGVVIPVVLALWEFVLLGFKRLGYRVQMDTTARDEVHPSPLGEGQQLWPGLRNASVVLLRIENNGIRSIDASDYQAPDHDPVGLRFRFPGRKVHKVVVTEMSPGLQRSHFNRGLGSQRDLISLPKVKLNRGQHYKVLAVLSSDTPPPTGEYEDPVVEDGGLLGGFRSGRIGRIRETRSRSRVRSWWSPELSVRAAVLVSFLVLVILGQYVATRGDDSAPLDCAPEGSRITVVGSTAFTPVLRDAADSYEGTCPDTRIDVRTDGSIEGVELLDREERRDMVAFSDGRKPRGHPLLMEQPIAFSLFTLVVNPEAGVKTLSLGEIQEIYGGEYVNWSDLGNVSGEGDTPVVLVSRDSGSGTRQAFEKRVLHGTGLPRNSNDCRTPLPGTQTEVMHCEVSETDAVIDRVAEIDGAIGYVELGAAIEAEERGDVELLRIDGQGASLNAADHSAYPFWETEYAYTYDEPEADSLVAGFLRYLTNEVGRDIIRQYEHRPCAELRNPVLCRPPG
jgi:ABC-type phosphate transport system substrate-binding protein